MIGAYHTQHGARGWILVLLRWAAAVAVLGALIHFLPLHLLGTAIARVPPLRFLEVLAVYLLGHALGVVKWRMVVNAAGAELDFAASAQCYFGGLFGALFLPSIVGGDAIRLAVGLRRSPRPAAVLAGNIVDRTLDLAAQTGLVLLALALLPGSLPLQTRARTGKALLLAALAIALLAAFLILLWRPIFRGRSVHFLRRLARLRHAFHSVSQKSYVLVYGWLAATIIQTVFLVLTARLAAYCDLILPLRVWFFAWPLAKLAAMLPVTQGGIGIREAALVALLAPFGAPKYLILAAGLLWEAVVIAGGLISGALALVLRPANGRVPFR